MAAIFMQQINVLAPRLMGNFTGLNPIWIFIALLIGAQIAGLLGAIIAVRLLEPSKAPMPIRNGSQNVPTVTIPHDSPPIGSVEWE